MWARRLSPLCGRLSAAGSWSGNVVKLNPESRLCPQHAGVSAGWRTSSGCAQQPGVTTCLLQSCRPYSVRIPDVESTEDGPHGGPGEALPEFNINVLVNLLRQENGKDLCVIRIPPEMKYVEYFVVVGGTSTRHLQAMAQYILKVYKFLKKESEPHVCLEGRDTDDWMCIDFGNIVVHFMLPESREAYELEKLWTLRSYDDQLSQMADEVLPSDFTFGLEQHKE
ncbi:mitochondrial assembly of ribosomal large subunit protein 1 [Leptodactylus fuscus]|uniref:mitochondrial assembly of ribosomal large subunit protein 1 n=1 Tax=Leptodactylus fuscus TaxID=238119 RepID=UPI003F4ECFCD